MDTPSADVARVNLADGSWLTFGKSTSGSYFPEPGAESLTLTKPAANIYLLTDLDGTVVEFTQQTVQTGSTSYLATATWTAEADVQIALPNWSYCWVSTCPPGVAVLTCWPEALR